MKQKFHFIHTWVCIPGHFLGIRRPQNPIYHPSIVVTLLQKVCICLLWGGEEIGGNLAGKEIHEEKQTGFEHIKHPWTCVYKKKKSANSLLIFMSLMLRIREKAWKALGRLLYDGPVLTGTYRTPLWCLGHFPRKVRNITLSSEILKSHNARSAFCVYFPLVLVVWIIRTKASCPLEKRCCFQKY